MTSKKKLALKKPSTMKTKLTHKFLASLSRIRRATNGYRVGSSSNEEIRRKSHRIKMAAYLSMAGAVGSKRVWSRALLLKLRYRTKSRKFLRNKSLASKKKKYKFISRVSSEMGKTDMLRKLVPGGVNMGLCELLEETEDYVKCLATQVKVMQRIVDYYSK